MLLPSAASPLLLPSPLPPVAVLASPPLLLVVGWALAALHMLALVPRARAAVTVPLPSDTALQVGTDTLRCKPHGIKPPTIPCKACRNKDSVALIETCCLDLGDKLANSTDDM